MSLSKNPPSSKTVFNHTVKKPIASTDQKPVSVLQPAPAQTYKMPGPDGDAVRRNNHNEIRQRFYEKVGIKPSAAKPSPEGPQPKQGRLKAKFNGLSL